MFGLKGKLALAGLLIGLASPVAAQTPIFRMDCGTNGSNWPRCGWSDELTDCSEGYCSKTRIPGGSPSGRDSVRIEGRLNPGSTAQYDYGWLSSYGGLNDTRPRGARYARWRIKLLGPVQWRDHVGGAAASKLVILGNGCDDRTSRIISNIGPYASGAANQSAPLDFWTARNIEGGGNEIRLMDALVADQWLNIQIMAAPGVGLSQWVNNNNQSAPNGRTTDPSVTDTNWRNSGCELHFGSTMAALAGLGSIRFELADFEYDDRFDPNWNIGGGGGGGGTPTAPAAPSNVRIVTASIGLPMIGALGLLLRRRRPR